MKKFTTMLVLSFLVCVNFTFAQSRNISGTVFSGADKLPVIGATVIISNSDNGSITDQNGKFELKNVKGAITLEVSMLGYETANVSVSASETKIDIKLDESSISIEEVVVTGLGISRAKKALGYAVQEVDGEELTKARTNNLVGALAGRVAGVQISQASGQLGGGAKINVRGNTSFTGQNQPLFVVDGVPISNADFSTSGGYTSGVATGSGGYDMGNLASDLNSDDIESMSVLKGASATAIYGSRGANGVVLITTKKAKSGTGKSFGVSVNSSVTIDKAGIMPQLQNLYGGGVMEDGSANGFLQQNIGGQSYNITSFEDMSWGPKYDPNINVLRWNSFDKWDTENYLKATPWVYPKNDYKTFFETGVGTQNNVQVQGSDDAYSYRLSYTNLKQTGITPGASLLRHTVSFNGTAKMNKWLDSWVAFNYVETKGKGRPETGYGDRNPVQKMWQWSQSQLDYNELRDYINPDGSQRTWNRTAWNDATAAYTDNPYWSTNKNYQNDRRDRIYGNAGINITPLQGLKITARAGMDMYNLTMEERMAAGSAVESEYMLEGRNGMETTFDVFATYNKRFIDDQLGLSVMFGASSNDRKTSLSGGLTVGGLVVPDIYNLSNSFTKSTVYDSKAHRRTNSMFANATFDWGQLVYLDITARNDWSSTLSPGNWSFFYPSFNLSVILTELEGLKKSNWLSFAKVRGGWASVGNDTGAYVLQNYYNANASFGSDPRYSLSSLLNNGLIRPEKTKSWEVGIEARFLHNRLGFDVAYYDKKSIDQIVPVMISAATGYLTSYINAGEMSNRGFEVTFNATPFQTKGGFTWDMQLNFATLRNRVVSITDDLNYINLGSAPFKAQSGAFTGMSYPIIYGTDYVYDDNGNKLIDPLSGTYISSEVKPIADVTPNITAGFSNTFRYKGFDLSILFDSQFGGNMYYTSNMFGMQTGMFSETAQTTIVDGKIGNIREQGIVLDGVYGAYNTATGKVTLVDADGNTSSSAVKNDIAVDAQAYGDSFYGGVDAQSVFSTDYIKLREVRFGYTFPRKWTGPIKDIRLSVYGRNLATLMRDNVNFDPEYLQSAGSNAQGLEGGYIPTTRTFGFGLSFNF